MKLATTVTEVDGGWEAEATALGITGCGRTREAAERDLADTVAVCWEEFSQTPREQMTDDAIALLERMRRAGVGT